MKKHIISAILTLAMLISITGCSSDTSTSVSDTAQTTASTSHSETPETTTQSTPTSIFSDSDEPDEHITLKKEIEIEGQTISLPCTAGEISNLYIDENTIYPQKIENKDYYASSAYFFYGDCRIGFITLFDDCSESKNLNNETVIGLEILSSEIMFSDIDDVNYMNLSFESTREDIVDAFGEPDEFNDIYLYYYFDKASDERYIRFGISELTGKIDDIKLMVMP